MSDEEVPAAGLRWRDARKSIAQVSKLGGCL